MIRIGISTLAYCAIVFPLALIWHVGLFKERYQAFGYFDGEPNVSLGLVTIVIQGVVLALLYPVINIGSSGLAKAAQFCALTGVFLWTTHVLAFVAKQQVPDPLPFVLMETGYLALQFGLFAGALALIYRNT
ncbi:hypothetical protein [Roseibium sp. Sym1]|uniref:hypothetical protein n=1 Tax=Roseibium sp. Sym1 TaxID=3016006 RepID=UPI0022B2BB4A|nr:hypothetical protein [Roseibium sp. Sym1]